MANILLFLKGNIVEADNLKGTCYFHYLLFGGPRFLYQFLDKIYLTYSNMRCPTCILMLDVVRVACALKVFPILRPKPVGLPELTGLVCTITRGDLWDTYYWQLDMAAL